MSTIMEEGLNFECSTQDCQSRFISEKHLFVHKKKHDMNLSLNKSNQILSDQTPTPTRFIRNCEAIGLFQDLQNVNPFEETFKKATELVKKGHNLRLPNVSTLGKAAGDDLHTPQVDIVEQTISSQSSCEEICVDRVVRSEADTSLEHSPSLSSIVQANSDNGKQKMNLSSNNLQLVFKMPGGTLLQISTLADSSGGSLAANSTTMMTAADGANGNTSSAAMNGSNAMFAALIPMQMMASTPPAVPAGPQLADRPHGPSSFNVKQKLKALLKNTKSFEEPATVDTAAATPKKCPIARMNPSLISSLQLQVKNDKKVTSSTALTEEKDSTEDKKRKTLERNRVAAMKCREKRKRWVADLRDNYVRMCSTNDALVKEVNFLRVEVSRLKELLLAHRDCPTFTEQLVTLTDTTPTSTSFSSTIRLEAAEMGEDSQEQFQGQVGSHGRASLRLDIEEASRNTVIDLDSPLVRRDELLGSVGPGCLELAEARREQRALGSRLRLDIEEASRNTVMDLDSPLVRRDEILTSVAPPTTPNERLISFPELTERVENDENSVTEVTETGERQVTTVIQINPNLLMKGSSTFS